MGQDKLSKKFLSSNYSKDHLIIDLGGPIVSTVRMMPQSKYRNAIGVLNFLELGPAYNESRLDATDEL